MAYYKTCSVAVYTGYPGKTYVSMDIETGSIGRCSIYIGKDEADQAAAYRRALAVLENRIKETALGATNTQSGKVEQIDKPVSTSIVTENKEDCNR